MRLLLILLFAIFSANLFSQVTIGMGESPIEGALLQLKQTETTGVNSNKGLALPRVKLTSITDLYPMFALDPTNDTPSPNEMYNDATKKQEQDDLHIGLLVYNVNQCLNYDGDSKGLQVWNGEKWEKLNNQSGSTVRGISGRVYKTATFGNAEWMIENLEETEYDSESNGSGTLTIGRAGAIYDVVNPSSVEELLARYYFPYDGNYLNSDGRAPSTPEDIAHDRVYYDKNKQYGIGLLYSWQAATAGDNTDVVLSTQAPLVKQYSTVQGICPNGWRIPSESDWLELEKEISDNAPLYSTNPTPTPWSTAYENGSVIDQSARGGHGSSMKSICNVPGYTGTPTNGQSKPNGFNLMLIGYVGTNNKMDSFGSFTAMFSSSLYQLDASSQPDRFNFWGRAIGNDANGVRRDKEGGDQLQPIRCVKARQ